MKFDQQQDCNGPRCYDVTWKKSRFYNMATRKHWRKGRRELEQMQEGVSIESLERIDFTIVMMSTIAMMSVFLHL